MSPLSFRLDDPDEWVCDVPLSLGTFLEKPITIAVEQEELSAKGPAPSELKLVDNILANLQSNIATAEVALKDYAKDPEALSHVTKPQIWIDCERELPDEWSFVVERDDWPDFGWHIEFKGTEFIEIWAGD